MSGPGSIHCPCGPVDLSCVITYQESSKFSNIINWAELSWWLFLLNKFLWGLLCCNVVSLGNDIDLLFDQRSQDPTWANGVRSNSVFGVFEGCSLGKSYNTMLWCNVGALVDWGYQTVNWGDVDDSSPTVLKHVWDAFFWEIKCWAQV